MRAAPKQSTERADAAATPIPCHFELHMVPCEPQLWQCPWLYLTWMTMYHTTHLITCVS